MLRKIVSGGQTGADRAGLDFAIEAKVEHGGFVPKGRIAEDGPIDPTYQLTELTSVAYEDRTRENVLNSDGTVIFSLAEKVIKGTELTLDCAREHNKPVKHIHDGETQHNSSVLIREAEQLRNFVESYNIEILNVAGSRESEEPGIYQFTLDVLRKFWNH
jgi:hypothetical protein